MEGILIFSARFLGKQADFTALRHVSAQAGREF
jgi:hypothetical protein